MSRVSILTLIFLLTIPAVTTGAGLEESEAEQNGVAPAEVQFTSNQVLALFDLNDPAIGPFPSDQFTASDPTQITGRRVDLPLPDCGVRPTDCQDIGVLNQLDGFNTQPRLTISFNGPIDPSSVSSDSLFLLQFSASAAPRRIGINEIVWDPTRLVVTPEADELLDQHAQFVLVATKNITDTYGKKVQPSSDYRKFLESGEGEYHKRLVAGIAAAEEYGIPAGQIVTASVFTTMSTTSVMEKIRDQLDESTPQPADFLLGPMGSRTVFELSSIQRIVLKAQTNVNPPAFSSSNVPLSQLNAYAPGVVGRIAFGRYVSPDYMTHPGEYIPRVGTLAGIPQVQGQNAIYFNLFIPSSPKPATGWPVAIVGHGGGGHKDADPYFAAAALASKGFATIAITAVGRGRGPLGTLSVELTSNQVISLPAGGRGFDQDGDNVIGMNEGSSALAPQQLAAETDGNRQTVVDWMQLKRVIAAGVDVDGDGTQDLDPSRISFEGNSFSGGMGFLLLAIDPIAVGALTVPGGASGRIDIIRLRPGTRGSFTGAALAARQPSLINPNGLTSLDGVPVGPPFFDENLPFRNEPPRVNDVAGAFEIQEVFEHAEWANQLGDATAHAPYLRKSPLPGNPPKSVLVQLARGDRSANPRNSATIRAGDLADVTTYLRNDLAFAEDPSVPRDPHLFLARYTSPGITGAIARGGHEQWATFLASDGATIIHPDPARFWEVPIVELPETLQFIP